MPMDPSQSQRQRDKREEKERDRRGMPELDRMAKRPANRSLPLDWTIDCRMNEYSPTFVLKNTAKEERARRRQMFCVRPSSVDSPPSSILFASEPAPPSIPDFHRVESPASSLYGRYISISDGGKEREREGRKRRRRRRRRRRKVTVGRAGICRIWKHEVDTCYVK